MLFDVLKDTGILYFVIQQTIVSVYFPQPFKVNKINNITSAISEDQLIHLTNRKGPDADFSYIKPITDKTSKRKETSIVEDVARNPEMINDCKNCLNLSISPIPMQSEAMNENTISYEKRQPTVSPLPTAELLLPTPMRTVEPSIDPLPSINPGCGCGMVAEKGMETICLCLE